MIQEANLEISGLVKKLVKHGYRKEIRKIAYRSTMIPTRHIQGVIQLVQDMIQDGQFVIVYIARGAFIFKGGQKEAFGALQKLLSDINSSPPLKEREWVKRAVSLVTLMRQIELLKGSPERMNHRYKTLRELENVVPWGSFGYHYDRFALMKKLKKIILTKFRMRNGWKDEYLQKAYDLMTIENVMKG